LAEQHGITAGGVYLGGDGACYIEPAQDIRPLEQGFALRFEYDGQTIPAELKQEGAKVTIALQNRIMVKNGEKLNMVLI
jgi:hypothetical protein